MLIWIVASAYTLWHFGDRDRRVFDPQARSDPATLLAPLLDSVPARTGPVVFVFWDAGCSCSRAALRHLRELSREYLPRGVRVVVVPGPRVGDPAGLREELGPAVEWLARTPAPIELPSAPAAAVIDAGGRVQYYGPLADGLLCAGGETGPVERTLELVLAGRAEPLVNRLGVACLCEWRLTAG